MHETVDLASLFTEEIDEEQRAVKGSRRYALPALSPQAVRMSDQEFEAELVKRFRWEIENVIEQQILTVFHRKALQSLNGFLREIKPLAARKGLLNRIRFERAIRDAVWDYVAIEEKAERIIKNRRSNLAALLERLFIRSDQMRHQKVANSERRYQTARAQVSKKFYGKLRLLEDLIIAKSEAGCSLTFRVFLERHVLIDQALLKVLRRTNSRKKEDSPGNIDIETFLRTYRNHK